MTQTTETVATEATKTPSKKSLALAIFSAALAARANGEYSTNKEFRAAVLGKIMTELSVSTASAATMYNAAKKDAEAADTNVKLGRDPKREKVKGTGKRGRPVGSKKKATVTVAVETTAATPETVA